MKQFIARFTSKFNNSDYRTTYSVFRENCKNCGDCAKVCMIPGAIETRKVTINMGHALISSFINHNKCNDCGACEFVCQHKAIKKFMINKQHVKTA